MYFPPARQMTFEAALRDLGSADARVRVAAADALGNTPAGPDRARAAEGLEKLLDDPRFEVRVSAALALGDLEILDVVPALLAHLEDGHPEVRQALVIALGRLGDQRAVERLVAAVSEGPADVRFQAVRSLAELDPAAAFEPLCRALADSDPEVRESAAESLALVGDRRAAARLADLLGDARLQTRFAAAAALAGFADGRGFDVLVAALADKELAYAAVEGLEQLADARAAVPLATLMKRFLVPDYLKVRAAAALLTVAPADVAAPAARNLLEKSRKSRRPEVKGLAEECLARLGS
jgi:HEAT repeat protein